MLAVGNQHSYSDVCVPIDSELRAPRNFIKIDPPYLLCDTGFTIGEALKYCAKRGWTLPVMPGTSHATIGGCIANDVHGKNHIDDGSFGNHIYRLNVTRSNEWRHSVVPGDPIFHATIGGLGLTGMIAYCWIKLCRSKPKASWRLFPLDMVPYYWPIYKRLGFWQYHCVVHLSALKHLYREITQKPLLTVHKRFGDRPSAGMLSFCRPGVSLSLDFARPDAGMMARLDRIVIDSGGAVYPAKTSMSREMFQASFPRWKEFQKYIDPAFSSSFSRRVGLTSG